MKLDIAFLSKNKQIYEIIHNLTDKNHELNLCSELSDTTNLVITDDEMAIVKIERWLYKDNGFKRAILSDDISNIKVNSKYIILNFYSPNIINNLMSIINLLVVIEQLKDDRWILKHKYFQLTEHFCDMHRKAELFKKYTIYDSKLHCFNYRYFRMKFQAELNQAIRFNLPISFIMIDVDNFKHYNDAEGHIKGDAALINIVNVLRNNIRNIDYLFRYGGDEFVIMLPMITLQNTVKISRRLQRKVEDLNIFCTDKRKIYKITISIGVGSFASKKHLRNLSYKKVIQLIDKATYKAKEMGKNRIFVHYVK